MLVGLLALASLAGPLVGPSAPQRYRIEVKAQQEVDMSAMGNGKQTTDVGIIGFLTVTLSDTAGGQIAHVVVDSMAFPAGIEPPPGMTDTPESGKGVSFHGYIVDGRAKGGFKPSQQHQLATLLSGGIESLFPGVRATAKAGDSWSDTTKTDTTAPDGGVQKSTTMIDWTATAGSDGALSYEGKSTGTMMREGQSPNGKQTVNSKITGTRTLSGPAAGPMRKGVIKSLQDVLVMVEGMSDAIPVTATTEVTFTIIP